MHHFRHLVEGHSFSIYTDHMAIIKAMEKMHERPILRKSRMLSFISQFDVTVVHIPGEENQVSDILSRPMGYGKSQFSLFKRTYKAFRHV